MEEQENQVKEEVQVIDEFEIMERIGGGGFSQVHIAKHLPTGNYSAAKIVDLSRLKSHEFTGIMREISVFMQVEHPHVCSLYRLSVVDKKLVFFIEFAGNGTLLSYVNKNGGLSEMEAQRIFVQIFEVLRFLHVQFFLVHRDLKLENILLDQYNNVKLTDFGLASTSYCNLLRSFVGTPGYTPPEILAGSEYDEKCDIWSLGVCLYAMLTGNLPFTSQNTNYRKLVEEAENLKYPLDFSPVVVDILQRMLEYRPSARANIMELQNHPFLRGLPPMTMNIAPTPIVFYKVSGISDISKFKRRSVKPNTVVLEKCEGIVVDIEKLTKELFEGLVTNNTATYFSIMHPLAEKPKIPEQPTTRIISSGKFHTPSQNMFSGSKSNPVNKEPKNVYKKAAALVIGSLPANRKRRGSVRTPQ